MSVRSSILADMEAVLKGISGVGDVYTGKYEQVDLDQLTLPALFVLQGSDQEAARSTGYECKDTDAETVFASIHTALSADPTRGGTSMNCRRTGSDILSLDPGRGLIALQQTYEILYRHPIGSP
jgi:hypothetical protein